MGDDGHKYFFGGNPEMPWRKDMKMENVREVVKAFLAMVEVKEIKDLDEKKLYKIIMMAHSQGLGRK